MKGKKNVMNDASNDWDTGDFDSGTTPSSHGEPLINIKTW
jgi:hypothetical protein